MSSVRARRRSRPPTGLHTTASAKINWTLEVLAKRPDGYHEIRSVMVAVSLHDVLQMQPARALSLIVDGAEASPTEIDDNLVTRAAQMFPSHVARQPVRFTLTKSIPAAAGLGGGSSNAAAALRLLAGYWGLDAESVRRAAAQLGSDVPFFLRGGTSMAAGRGERLTPLPDPPAVSLLLTTPPRTIPNKTARLFSLLTPAHFTDGAATERLAATITADRAPDAADYVNVFDAVADAVFPWLPEHRAALTAATGSRAMLAGAGPALFAPYSPLDRDHAAAVRADLLRQGIRTVAVSTLPAANECGGC